LFFNIQEIFFSKFWRTSTKCWILCELCTELCSACKVSIPDAWWL